MPELDFIRIKLATPAVGPYTLADGTEWHADWYNCSTPEPTEACWSVHVWDNDEREWVHAADEATARAVYAAAAMLYFDGYGAVVGKTIVEATAALCYGVPDEVLSDEQIVESKYIACSVQPEGIGTITSA